MQNICKIFSNYLTIKNVSYASLVLNLASILLGIIYYAIPIYTIIWDIFGIILLITLFCNLLFVYLNDNHINKNSKLGNRLNLFSYIYLIFIIIGMIAIPIDNFIISSTYSNDPINIISYLMGILVFFFGILTLGFLFAYFNIKNLNNKELWNCQVKGVPKRTLRARKLLKLILGIICFSILFFGILLLLTLLFMYWIVWAFLPTFALFFAFLFLSTMIILFKLIDRQKKKKVFTGVAISGLLITGILMIPLILVPYNIYEAENSFADAFGNDWSDNIDLEVAEKYFLKSQFWISGYFLGIPPKECNYEKDVLYFDGSESNYSEDEDIELYFDVFWPKDDVKDLPGKTEDGYSIIIKIHGGSWRYGDKGVGNRMQANKYFAAQGYIVYDIQYGLKETDDSVDILFPTPVNVLGDFDVDDMVRHIGNFCQYIAEDSNIYSADDLDGNLDYVFVSGGSAGGHLTCTTALAIADGGFPEIFGTNLTIKGMVPFFPANGQSGLEGKDYGEVFDRPEKHLINLGSPPCLIYQGMQDTDCVEVSKAIKKEYEDAGNDECCIIWLHMAGHANDIYFSGYYNTVFLYYMERFLYLCVEGEIE